MGPCICKSIPKTAEAAVMINARNIERHFLHDVLSNPMSYLRSDMKDAEIDQPKIDIKPTPKKPNTPSINLLDCIEVPKFALMYREKDSWKSSPITIKDKAKLSAYLKQNEFEQLDDQTVYAKGSNHIVINQNNVYVIHSERTPTITELTGSDIEYLEHGNIMFEALLKGKSDMVYADQAGQYVDLNFDSGAIVIAGQYDFEILKPSTNVLAAPLMGEISAVFDVAVLNTLLSNDQKSKWRDYSKLNLDSLEQSWDGSLNAALQDFVVVADTVITFDYDDDFNKVEKKTVKNTTVADFGIEMGMDTVGFKYLMRKKAIVTENGQQVLAIMPLVKTYCQLESNRLKLNSSPRDLKTTPSESKLKISLDAESIMSSQGDLTAIIPTKMARNIRKFEGSISNDNQIRARLEIGDQRNALVGLIGN